MSITYACQGGCGRRQDLLHGFCEECIRKFCQRCGKIMQSDDESSGRAYCSGCLESKIVEKANGELKPRFDFSPVFDRVLLDLRRQLRQLDEEKTELSYSKHRVAVTLQIAQIEQKMRDIRSKIKTRQTGGRV